MKILYLSPWFPTPSANGSKIRIHALLSALAWRHEVHLISFMRAGEQVDINAAKKICASIQITPWHEFAPRRWKALLGFFSPIPRSLVDTYSREMKSLCDQITKEITPDVIISSEFGTSRYVNGSDEIYRIFEDIEIGRIWEERIKASSRMKQWRRNLTWIKARHYIGRKLNHFDACTVVSDREKTILKEIAPDFHEIHLIPNGVDLDAMQTGLAEPHPTVLIYNGALTYNANFDAMHYFLKYIFPSIRLQMPETHLKITGSYKGVDLDAFPLNGQVTLTGYLPDVRHAVAGAWACVVPLRMGGGTRIKILEAMALGTPVIATSKGAEGLDVTSGENILIADEPGEFAAQTVRLLRDPDLRAFLADNARKLVEGKYGWDAIGEKFLQLVEEVASRGRKNSTDK